MKIADILLTLIFIVLVIIWYFVWNIDSQIWRVSFEIENMQEYNGERFDKIISELNNIEITVEYED